MTQDSIPLAQGQDRHTSKTVVGFLLLAALAGCVSARGLAEFRLYRSTYEAAEVTVRAILDEFEGVERERSLNLARTIGLTPIRVRELKIESKSDSEFSAALNLMTQEGAARISANGGFDDRFHPIDSVYHATNQAPPATASFRRAFAAIGSYNEILAAYAEGRALDELKAQTEGLASSIGALAEALGAGSDLLGIALPGGSLVSTGLGIVTTALEAGTRQAFRDEIVRLEPVIDDTLQTMRDASPHMFGLFTSKLRGEAKDAPAGSKERAMAIEAIEAYRTVMSNWVVALSATEDALQGVIVAIRAPATPGSVIADISAASENAASVAGQTRRLLGEIRTRS